MSLKTPSNTGCSYHFTTPPRTTITTTPKSSRSATPAKVFRRINTPSSARRTPGDRFIPNRAATNLDFSSYKMNTATRIGSENTPVSSHVRKGAHEKLLSLKGCSSDTRILSFKRIPTSSASDPRTPGKYQYWSSYSSSLSSSSKKTPRKIPKSAEKVLDAPNLMNDFYLNVLDWSKQGHLTVALGSSVYLLAADGKGVNHLCNMETDSIYVSSLKWNKSGRYLAIGTSDAEVQLWDVNACKMVRRMRTHDSRVSSMAWDPCSSLLSSGSQSGVIHNYDARMAQFHKNTLKAHTLDVCGLRWAPNGRFLASGGNDNAVNIWDTYSRDPWEAPAHTFKEHTAAVKALAWCPWQPSLLATGGGSADRHIRLWNACTGRMEGAVDTGSQVSGLLWSSPHRELLSSHGHPHNHLTLWHCPSLTQVAQLPGHEERILHIAMSPDGQTVASTGADETLRFWKCFAVDSSQRRRNDDLENLSYSELSMPRYIR